MDSSVVAYDHSPLHLQILQEIREHLHTLERATRVKLHAIEITLCILEVAKGEPVDASRKPFGSFSRRCRRIPNTKNFATCEYLLFGDAQCSMPKLAL